MTDTTTSGTSAGRGSVIMAAGTFVSRGLGMVRNVLLVAAVGATGPIANAFDIANKLPNVLYALLATGLINAILVPQIVRAMRTPNGQEFVDKLLTAAGSLILLATIVLTLAARPLVQLYTDSSWTSAQVSLAVALALWCTPQLFFYGLYAILGQVLNARSQFGPYMWAPAVNNVISIVGFGVYLFVFGRAAMDGSVGDLDGWTTTQTVWIGGVATLGIAAQAFILIIPLKRSGFRWNLRFGVRGIGLRSAGAVSFWVILATLVDQIGIWWITRLATAAPVAAVRDGFSGGIGHVASNGTYTQALMIYLLPHSLVTVSITTALFTGMSKAATANDIAGVRTHLSSGLRTVGVFTVAATAAMVVMAVPLTKALVPSMRSAEVIATAPVLQAMAWGLVPLGAMVLFKWAFFAFEDGRTVFLMQLPGTASLLILAWAASRILPGQMWVVGIGAAMALSNVVVVAARARGLRLKLSGLDGHRVVRLHVRVILAALVAVVPTYAVVNVLDFQPGDSWFSAVVVCCLGGGVMLGVYVLMLRVLRVGELQALAAPILRRLRRH